MFPLCEYCERTTNPGEFSSFKCARTIHIKFRLRKFTASGTT